MTKRFGAGSRALLALGLVAAVAAGCSQSGSGTGPLAVTPQAVHAPGGTMHSNDRGGVQLVAPLSFDTYNFYTQPANCGHVRISDAPVYNATFTGVPNLGAAVNLTPECNTGHGQSGDAMHGNSLVFTPTPSPVPTTPGNVYVIAYQCGGTSGNGHGTGDDAMRAPKQKANSEGGNGCADGSSVSSGPMLVAGPVNLSDSPWSFAVISPGFSLTNGANYAFFVATVHGNSSGTSHGHDN